MISGTQEKVTVQSIMFSIDWELVETKSPEEVTVGADVIIRIAGFFY